MRLLLLLLLTPFFSFAQNDFVVKRVIELDSSLNAAPIYKKALRFAKTKKDKFFFSNGQRNAGWELLAGKQKASDQYTTTEAKSDIGFDSADPDEKSILVRCAMRYEGSMIGCPRLLIFKADVFIDCKDGKSKIELRNFTYSHYNISTNRPENVAGKKCPAKGTAEQLDDCDGCGGTDKAIDFMMSSAKNLAKQYKEFMLAPDERNNDW